jgi:hypothetical protein
MNFLKTEKRKHEVEQSIIRNEFIEYEGRLLEYIVEADVDPSPEGIIKFLKETSIEIQIQDIWNKYWTEIQGRETVPTIPKTPHFYIFFILSLLYSPDTSLDDKYSESLSEEDYKRFNQLLFTELERIQTESDIVGRKLAKKVDIAIQQNPFDPSFDTHLPKYVERSEANIAKFHKGPVTKTGLASFVPIENTGTVSLVRTIGNKLGYLFGVISTIIRSETGEGPTKKIARGLLKTKSKRLRKYKKVSKKLKTKKHKSNKIVAK